MATMECPCCGDDGAKSDADGLFFDGQSLICDCRGQVSCDAESPVEIDVSDCDETHHAYVCAAREEGRREGREEAMGALERGEWRPDATDVAVKAHGKGQDDGYREGYAACTADVVAWLKVEATSRAESAYECIAEDIERGEHVGAAGKVGK